MNTIEWAPNNGIHTLRKGFRTAMNTVIKGSESQCVGGGRDSFTQCIVALDSIVCRRSYAYYANGYDCTSGNSIARFVELETVLLSIIFVVSAVQTTQIRATILTLI